VGANAASEDDDLGVEEEGDIGDGVGEDAGGVAYDFAGDAVAFGGEIEDLRGLEAHLLLGGCGLVVAGGFGAL